MGKAGKVELHIAEDLALPATVVTQTIGILAVKGSGKTYTALVLAEELYGAGLPVVVIDPVGVCWGLRASANGQDPGLPILVMGGDHGDVPLESTSGKVIAEFIVESRQSAVLDLSEFSGHEMQRFVTDFAETLYRINRQPLHLMVDEADMFSPQNPLPGERQMLGAMDKVVRRGRARGLGVTLITQRPAAIHKNVLTQIEMLVVLRIAAPQDLAAIESWIKVHGTPIERETLMQSLPALPVGTAWFWSPSKGIFQKARVRARKTFDSSATPEIGAEVRVPATLAEVDLASLKERIAATLEKAKSEDSKVLQGRIRELEAELRARAAKGEVVTVEVPVVSASDAELVRSTVASFRAVTALLRERLDRLEDLAEGLTSKLTKRLEAARPVQGQIPAKSDNGEGPRSESTGGGQVDKGAEGILQTLVRHHPMKVTRAQLSTLAGRGSKSSSFAAQVSALKKEGLIEEVGGLFSATRAGLERLGDAVPRGESTIELWRRALQDGPRRMLDELIEVYPAPLTKDELARESGFSPTSSSVGAHLGTLRRNGLVEVRGSEVRASDTLFLRREG